MPLWPYARPTLPGSSATATPGTGAGAGAATGTDLGTGTGTQGARQPGVTFSTTLLAGTAGSGCFEWVECIDLASLLLAGTAGSGSIYEWLQCRSVCVLECTLRFNAVPPSF